MPYLLINASTDPVFNMAAEEYLLTKMALDVVMLWRNEKAVIIGNNQNAMEEMDVDYVKANNIAVLRRQSGGGAVFHDLGNINFTVVHAVGADDFSNYAKFTAPVCDFLNTLDVHAKLEGRNDLVIDGMKFSGNAQAVVGERIMHHGTLLYNADFGDLVKALKPRESKIASKGIKSIRSRVTNVSSHMPYLMTVDAFFDRLASYFRDRSDGEYSFTEADLSGIRQLVKDKYSRWEWNFGRSPFYTYEKEMLSPTGSVQLRLNVDNGIINNAYIYGDFFGVRNKQELEQKLAGLPHEKEHIRVALKGIDIASYIHGMTESDFVELF